MPSMTRAFGNALKIGELRGKILFTIGILAVYRFGSFVPIPGIDFAVLAQLPDQAQQAGGAAGVLNLFSGGALTQLAVFALGIMPYITASIIMQLLTVVIPRLEEWQKEGETGTQKITQWTRYLTVVLAILQSTGLLVLIANQPEQIFGTALPGLIPDASLQITLLQVLTLTAGTAFIMWLGELITQRGIGNGMSLIIFTSIVSQLPSQGVRAYTNSGPVAFAVVCLVGARPDRRRGLRRAGAASHPGAVREAPALGRRTYGGTSTYIPLKVNQAGVIPIIFASSLLYLPSLAASIINNPGLEGFVNRYFTTSGNPVFIITTFVLVIFFSYFYTAITFNPIDVADNMKKYGGFIPGIRPGRPTAEYLDKVLTRITLPGSLYLGLLAVLPYVAFAVARVDFPLGGTSLLIVVGVGLETMKQLESQLLQRNYEGFLRS